MLKRETLKSDIVGQIWKEKKKEKSGPQLFRQRTLEKKTRESEHMLGINFLNRPNVNMNFIWEPLIKKEYTLPPLNYKSQA